MLDASRSPFGLCGSDGLEDNPIRLINSLREERLTSDF